MSLEALTRAKTVLKQTREESLILRQGYHAVPNVARRQHIEFAAEASGTAAIVGYGYDCGDVDGQRIAWGMSVFFKSGQQ
jgi:hypothetical protein